MKSKKPKPLQNPVMIILLVVALVYIFSNGSINGLQSAVPFTTDTCEGNVCNITKTLTWATPVKVEIISANVDGEVGCSDAQAPVTRLTIEAVYQDTTREEVVAGPVALYNVSVLSLKYNAACTIDTTASSTVVITPSVSICDEHTWTPDYVLSTVCSNETVVQLSNCLTTRVLYGTKDCTPTSTVCVPSEWSPAANASNICVGESVLQTNGCDSRILNGTKNCTSQQKETVTCQFYEELKDGKCTVSTTYMIILALIAIGILVYAGVFVGKRKKR